MDSQQKREAKRADEMLQAIDAYDEVSYSEDRPGILCAIVDLAGHSRRMDELYKENKALRAKLRNLQTKKDGEE